MKLVLHQSNGQNYVGILTCEGHIRGYSDNERQWTKADDVYIIEIEGLGQLSNRLVEVS